MSTQLNNQLNDVWQRIERWLQANAADIGADLSPGASDASLAAAADAFGAALPDEMADSYRIHDGARGGSAPLFGKWRLLSLEHAIKEWKQITPAGDDDDLDEVEDATAPQIKAAWWNPLWIPVASNSSGDFLCVDLDPATAGTRGQIISYYSAQPRRELIATGFAQWLAGFAADLERGAYRVEDEWLTRTK
jgi:cell wall assembly regulator SMI1